MLLKNAHIPEVYSSVQQTTLSDMFPNRLTTVLEIKAVNTDTEQASLSGCYIHSLPLHRELQAF